MNPVVALPHNLEAEQALLGALMFDNLSLESLPEGFGEGDFHEGIHGRLFAAIQALVQQGQLADPALLKDRFAQDAGFLSFGGLRFLLDLVDMAPPAAAAPKYARTLMDLSLRRQLMRIAGEILEHVPDGDMTGREHLQVIEQGLFSLAEAGETSRGTILFHDAMQGAVDMIEAAFKMDGKLTGLSTGLVDLDQKLGGLHPSDLLIVAGRPSMGKTALATNIAFNIARRWIGEPDETAPGGYRTRAGGRVMFYSLEMSAEQLAQRILAEASGVSSDRMRKGRIDRDEFARIKEVQAMLRDIPLWTEATGGLPIGRLCAKARREHRKRGLDLIVVDYLQLVTAGDGKGSRSRVQEVGEITGALKALAKELNVPILALSQLSRQVEAREDKRPMLSDLRESGSIEQDADCVMFVFREAYYHARTEPKAGSPEHLTWAEGFERLRHQAEVIVGKQRHGPIGTVRLSFDEDLTLFGNLAREQEEQASSARYGFGDAA